MTDYSKTIIKGTSVIFTSTLVTSIIAYLIKIFLARNLIISLFGIFLILPGAGSGRAVAKLITEEKTKQNFKEIKTLIKTGFLTNLAISTILGLLFIIFSKQLATHYLHDPETAKYIVIYAMGFILTPTIGIFKSIFMGYKQSKNYSIIDFSKTLLTLIFVFIFIKLNFGLMGVILAYVLVYILPLILFYPLFIKKTFPNFHKINAGVKFEKAKKILSIGIPLTIASTAGVIFGYVDTAIITIFRSLEEVALYNISLPTIKIIWNFERALSVILLPVVIELWAKKDNIRFLNGIKKVYKYIFMIVAPIIIILVTYPELILNILFGPQYVGAANTVRILALASIIIIFSKINLSIITGISSPKKVGKAMLLGALLNLGLNIILIPKIGINGAAIATGISFSFILLYTNKELKNIANINYPIKNIMKIIIASIVSMGTIYFLKAIINLNVYLEAILVLSIAAIMYLFIIFTLKVVSKEEIKRLIRK